MPAVAGRTTNFTESVIREMTRLVAELRPRDGINLAQGFPDFPAPAELKHAAVDAIEGDLNQYAVTWGVPAFREAIATKTRRSLGVAIDPDQEVTVTCGATEGMASVMLALVEPGDEVIVFEPFYENYGPDCFLAGAVPRYVRLNPPDWAIDPDVLAQAFSPRTKAIIVNTPCNPTGKVFTRLELDLIASLCDRYDSLILTDEIYEHMVYDGHAHLSPLQLQDVRHRVVAVNGLSKTYSVTGWRVGYVIAAARYTAAIRKVHDFLTVGAPAPLQVAGVAAMNFEDGYYTQLAAEYTRRRDRLLHGLSAAGYNPCVPSGAYYIMADFRSLSPLSDADFARRLIETCGVAAVPGNSFYSSHEQTGQVRFAFPKRMETLDLAAERLRTWQG